MAKPNLIHQFHRFSLTRRCPESSPQLDWLRGEVHRQRRGFAYCFLCPKQRMATLPSHLQLYSPQFRLILSTVSVPRSECGFPRKMMSPRRRNLNPLRQVEAKEVGIRCFPEQPEERDDAGEVVLKNDALAIAEVDGGEFTDGSASSRVPASGESLSLGIREPIYEVVEVRSNGMVSTRKINRRHLLKSSGLRPRDIRSVDPSLWLTNSLPSLLVRDYAVLLTLGSLRAIAMQDCVYIFNYNRKGGKAFIDALLPCLNPKNVNGGPSMPFILEVVEAALLSRMQRLEQRLMQVEPRVLVLLEVLPNKLTADILEELRTSKQTLVELGSRAGALKQMLLDILEDTHEIRRISIIGRNCTIAKNDDVECSVHSEKRIVEEEEEEIEMLLENYLQRCESCHGQAERLLDSAKEMEDSISVNLSSRRLEVSRVELLLQVGTFCVGLGALIAGIFGMNLKSYLEPHPFAFWLTTTGIFFGAVAGFLLMYLYLRRRKIL